MDKPPNHRLPEDRLAFFGRVGADVSHDMRNTLSIIGEYAGLLDDLMTMAEQGKFPDYAKLKGLSAKITQQVKNGTQSMERFSRFAHATDEPATSCDLTALVENTAALAQRRVALAGCRLQVQLPDRSLPVKADPSILQQAVFSAIELMLQLQEADASLTVKIVAETPAAVITISGPDAVAGSQWSEQLSGLQAMMKDLQGSIEAERTSGTCLLTLKVPTQ